MTRIPPISRRTTLVLSALLGIEVVAIIAWFTLSDWSVIRPASVAHPLVWINIAVFALLHVDVPRAELRWRILAGGLGGIYLTGLLWTAGVITPMTGPLDIRFLWLPPGWGPGLTVSTPIGSGTLFPYQVIGFFTLAFLLYSGLLTAFRSSMGALLGFAACIGCTVPPVTGVLVGFVGGTVPLAFGGTGQPAAVGTAIFAMSVALLLWRPTETDRP